MFQFSPVTIIGVYERVTQTTSVDEPSFIMYFNDTINELIGKYRPRYVILPNAVYTEIDSINDTANIYGLYSQSIAENIIYLIKSDTGKKNDFDIHSEQAYRTIYKEIMKGTAVNLYDFHSSGW